MKVRMLVNLVKFVAIKASLFRTNPTSVRLKKIHPEKSQSALRNNENRWGRDPYSS